MAKIFGALKSFFRVKDRQAADAIENTNIVEFAKNDMEDMQANLRTVQENVGHIKARIGQITADMTDIQSQIDNDTTKAQALLAKGGDQAEGVAKQLCAEIESLETRKGVLQQALDQQNGLLKQHENTKASLEEHIQECKNELDIMKTQKEVTDGNKTLVSVDSKSGESAVQKFKERRRKLDEQLRVSSAMVEETREPVALSKQADAILGKSKGSALFESLKAKSAPATPPPAA